MPKRFCILDPFFNRKFCAIFLLGFATILALRLTIDADKNVEAPLENRESASAAPPSGSYEEGYRNGYRAFQEQSGVYLPAEQYTPPYRSSQYVSQDFREENRSEEQRGYEDGYHKASRMQNCPGPY